jgi:hypothetical protein
VPMVWGILECLGTREAGSSHWEGGMEGCIQTCQTIGEALVGRGRGWGSVNVPGSWSGESGRDWDLWA